MAYIIKKVFCFQIISLLFVSFIAAISSNRPALAIFSALIGGGSAILPAIISVFYFHFYWNFWDESVSRSGIFHDRKKPTIFSLLLIQLIKVLLSAVLIFIAIKIFDNLDWFVLLVTYFLLLQTYLFLLIL